MRKPKIESPPKAVAVPQGAKHKPWIDLAPSECQWPLDDWWNGGSSQMPCCGLDTAGGIGLGSRFCEYHVGKALK